MSLPPHLINDRSKVFCLLTGPLCPHFNFLTKDLGDPFVLTSLSAVWNNWSSEMFRLHF